MSEYSKISILSNVLGEFFREGNSQLLFYCPRCDHHKKKLSVNIEKNVFKCWVCDFSGRNIYRVIKIYGAFQDRKQWLSLTKQVEIENFSDKLFETPKNEESVLLLPKEFISLANKNLPITSRYPINYLSSRGITKQDILKWKIGYCATGKYEGRVIFPSFDLSGRLNYFVARSYTGDWKRYSNPPNKSNIIFNHLSLDFAYPIVVVEGVFDAVKSGVNSVPLLGSTLKEESILLNEIVKNDTTVYLALDSDATKKTEKLIDLFLKYDIETFLVDISATKHQDVGEMTKQEFEFCKFNSEKVTISSYTTNRIMNI